MLIIRHMVPRVSGNTVLEMFCNFIIKEMNFLKPMTIKQKENLRVDVLHNMCRNPVSIFCLKQLND